MLYRFVERNDTGIETIARANVRNGMATWSGFQVETIRDLLENTKWRLLRNQSFDENKQKHWNQLPKLLTGSRLWVEVDERESNLELKQQERDTTLRAASSRLPMWVNRYTEVVNTAKIMAGGDKKLKWVLGPTEEHCSSCSKLAGQVRRASVWLASGIQPQSRALSCQGYNCLCTLSPTSDASSRGRMPSLP